VLFHKIASVYFILKIDLYFIIENGHSLGNRHCANCIGALSLPIESDTAEGADVVRLRVLVGVPGRHDDAVTLGDLM